MTAPAYSLSPYGRWADVRHTATGSEPLGKKKAGGAQVALQRRIASPGPLLRTHHTTFVSIPSGGTDTRRSSVARDAPISYPYPRKLRAPSPQHLPFTRVKTLSNTYSTNHNADARRRGRRWRRTLLARTLRGAGQDAASCGRCVARRACRGLPAHKRAMAPDAGTSPVRDRANLLRTIWPPVAGVPLRCMSGRTFVGPFASDVRWLLYYRHVNDRYISRF